MWLECKPGAISGGRDGNKLLSCNLLAGKTLLSARELFFPMAALCFPNMGPNHRKWLLEGVFRECGRLDSELPIAEMRRRIAHWKSASINNEEEQVQFLRRLPGRSFEAGYPQFPTPAPLWSRS